MQAPKSAMPALLKPSDLFKNVAALKNSDLLKPRGLTKALHDLHAWIDAFKLACL